MRRALVPGAILLLAVGVYALFFRLEPAHISELVPRDFSFGVFTRSLNDLRQLYEGPYAREDSDPAQLRYGRPSNVPGLDGVDYDAPAGSYWTDGIKDEVFLMPIRDARAFEDAFDRERENTRMRDPEWAAKNYASLSEQRVTPRRGARNDLVMRATRYPLALCGRPRDGAWLRAMLSYLLAREAPRKPDLPLLAREALRLPPGIADAIARECEDFLLGFPLPEAPDAPVKVVGEASLVPDGMVARSAHLAAEVDLTDIARSFPHNTVLLLGLVLDARAWQDVGMPLPLGDAAFACGILEEKIHARRFTVLFAARPASAHDLVRVKEQGLRPLVGEPAGLPWASVEDGSAVVRTAALPAPPAWLAEVLRSEAEAAPPVYVSTAVERGIWYCAIGSQAEGVVRRALGCLRDTPELGLSRNKAVGQHPAFLSGAHVGLALVTASGLKAFGYPMPYFEIASLHQPPSITAVLDVDERGKLEILIGRPER
ncbi:MAG: hypothetical protein ACHQ1G_10495 [Planctomycetota bacterium]